MRFQDVIIKAIRKSLANLGIDETYEIKLEHPGEKGHGDYATNIALKLKTQNSKLNTTTKKLKLRNPREIADEIVKFLKADEELGEVVEKVEVAGAGFINFWLKVEVLVNELKEIKKKKVNYGRGDWGNGQTWLLEHTSPNPNKAMHLGHLRNNVTGMAIGNLWEFSGVKVIRDCIENDRGIAIAKLMWGYLKFARKKSAPPVDIDYWVEHQDEWSTPEKKQMRPDRFVDELYVKAAEDFKNDKNVEKKIRQMVVDWEAEDKNTWVLWKKVLGYSNKGQEITLKRLGSKWDWVWYEHDHYQQGKELVEEGLKKKIFKMVDGAVITNLEKFGISDTVVRKSDGTALYITQDLALTKLKQVKFKPDKMFWVIGPEQSLALKQVFAVCDQLGIIKYEDCTHIAYGYMSIKGQGKMSSREGNVVYIDDLIDTAKNEVEKKMKEGDFGKKELEDIYEKVAVGAVKYSILKVGRMTDTAFDFKASLSFDGNSGPYLQYTYARARSVMRKSKGSTSISLSDENTRSLRALASSLSRDDKKLNEEELSVLRWIYRFPEVVEEAAESYAPNLMCNFLYELAQRFNTFYNQHSILTPKVGKQGATRETTSVGKSSNTEALKDLSSLREFRLLITKATAQVMKNGLNLLGIEAVERM